MQFNLIFYRAAAAAARSLSWEEEAAARGEQCKAHHAEDSTLAWVNEWAAQVAFKVFIIYNQRDFDLINQLNLNWVGVRLRETASLADSLYTRSNRNEGSKKYRWNTCNAEKCVIYIKYEEWMSIRIGFQISIPPSRFAHINDKCFDKLLLMVHWFIGLNTPSALLSCVWCAFCCCCLFISTRDLITSHQSGAANPCEPLQLSISYSAQRHTTNDSWPS